MILITGFGPYHEPDNASGRLVESLRESLPENLEPIANQLAFEVIHNDTTSPELEHQSLTEDLNLLLEKHRPDICLFTGQAPMHSKVMIERIATNSFREQIIDSDSSPAYWATLPNIDRLASKLEQQGIPAGDSYYAGQHLCNHILHSALRLADEQKRPLKAGFIHIPLLPSQVANEKRNAAHMSLPMTRSALATIILAVSESATGMV